MPEVTWSWLDILLQGVGDERQDLLVLIEQQTRGQVSQTLVGEARGGQQLDTFNLTKVRSLAQREEVQKLGDIVAPVSGTWSVYRMSCM